MIIKKTILFLCFAIISCAAGVAQSAVYSDTSGVIENSSILNTKANKLLNSISENKNSNENYKAVSHVVSRKKPVRQRVQLRRAPSKVAV